MGCYIKKFVTYFYVGLVQKSQENDYWLHCNVLSSPNNITVVGTLKERGMEKSLSAEDLADGCEDVRDYDMPFGNDWIYRFVLQ